MDVDRVLDGGGISAGEHGDDRRTGTARGVQHETIARGQPRLRQSQPAEAIALEGIRAGEIEHDAGAAREGARQRRRQQRQIPLVAGAVFQADIQIASRLERRIVVLLVHREREDGRVALEDHRRAVAVMHVEIDDGGVGIGYSLHAGMVVVADGTTEADERLSRVLTSDPGMGVVRHADAGYETAIATAQDRGVDMPMLRREPAEPS